MSISESIVLVTTYNRPEYLRLCLEYLSQAAGIEHKMVWVCIDRGKAIYRDICEVLNDFRAKMHIETRVRDEHSYQGNSFNTLEAYNEAYYTNARYVYLVEDDVLVQPDFFKWHEAAQATGDYLCSVAYRCLRNSGTFIGCTDPTAYFTTGRDYASIGVCWRREKLRPVIEHARPSYYENMEGYLTNHFPCNRFCDNYTEQDGLIMRVMGATHAVTVWPYVPRCYHIGFAGYNRPRGQRYTTEELKEIIHNPQKVADADRDFHDIEPVPTTPTADWSPKDLHLVQHFK